MQYFPPRGPMHSFGPLQEQDEVGFATGWLPVGVGLGFAATAGTTRQASKMVIAKVLTSMSYAS